MAAIDAAAPEPVEVLIERAGAAVARAAVDLMGGTYGRRVVVLAGPGHNGDDGRAAAVRLRRHGVRVGVVAAVEAGRTGRILPAADLYVDAAFGAGLSRPYRPPARSRARAPVLAVDIPSGLDSLTGAALDPSVWPADRTVTFAAMSPGLLFGAGPAMGGEVTVADIGLDAATEPACDLMTDDDVEALPAGSTATHKWHSAVLVVAGSPGMAGAAALTCSAAARSGARMVHLCAPEQVTAAAPIEVVSSTPPLGSDRQIAVERFHAVAVGPGLGTGPEAEARVAEALDLPLPAVVDADGLKLLSRVGGASRLRHRSTPTVLTPHDGELVGLTGSRPGPDRIAAARTAAAALGAIVVLKGGPTVVADPSGRVLITASGDARLATAGTGDVLTGVIAARLAAFGSDTRTEVFERVGEATHLHGRAATMAGVRITAGDVVAHLAAVTP